MFRLQSIGVFSCAKIFAVVHAAFGVLIGLIFLLIGVIGTAIAPGEQKFGMIGIIVVAVLMPFVYGILGFIMGAVWAFVYNLAAETLGGLELELEAVAVPALSPPPQPAGA